MRNRSDKITISMTPGFYKKWLEQCYEVKEGEYCFMVSIEPNHGNEFFSDEFWDEIGTIKSVILRFGGYDGHAYETGYQCEGVFKSFDKMIEAAQQLTSIFDRDGLDRLEWCIYVDNKC